MQVEVVEREETRVLAIRHIGPYPGIGNAFDGLGQLIGKLGLNPTGAQWLGIFHDDPQTVPAAELRSDACVTLTGTEPDVSQLEEGARLDKIPNGRYATMRHEGSYDGLPESWGKFMGEGLPAAGLKPRTGVCFEIYRNDPNHTPADDLITEIYVPVED